MAFQDVALGLVFDEKPIGNTAMDYALSLAGVERGRLSVLLCTPMLDLPSSRLVPGVRAMIDGVDRENYRHAAAIVQEIEVHAKLGAFSVQTRILQEKYARLTEEFTIATRLCDVCILPRPAAEFAFTKALAEAALFGSGRPIIIIPPLHRKPAAFMNIVVAWDGGARAARAIGDAMPLLELADRVDIACVSEAPKKTMKGTDMAAHLSRRCKNVELVLLTPAEGDAGRAIREHALKINADLIVMGAFAHSRLLQFVLGGVTNDMLLGTETPVLMSY